MDLRLTPLQNLLRQSVDDLLAAHLPAERLRELSAEAICFEAAAWAALAGHGWFSLEHEGEAGLVDLCLVTEACGRALLPGPVAATLAAAPWLQGAGSELARALAAGELVAELVADPGPPGFSLTPAADGWRLRGQAPAVGHGLVGTHLLVAVGDDLFLVPTAAPGVERVAVPALAHTGFCALSIDCDLPAGAWLPGAAPAVQRRFQAVLSAQMAGAAEAMLRMAVEYARQREQFGQPIGSYQAVQHRCVDTLSAVEGARLLVYQAAWRLDQGLPADLDLSPAAAAAAQCVLTASAHAHQVHGAMGYSEESLLPLFSRWARVATSLAGPRRQHLQQVAAHLLAGEWR